MATYFQKRFRSFRTFKNSTQKQCNSTLAILNGGNIRMSISTGNITYKSVLSTLPFGNQQGVLTATGSELFQVFEHSARQFRRGGFMQVSSSLRVTYNHTVDDHHVELVSVEALCQDGWAPLDAQTTYAVALNEFIAKGGDNYTMINATNWEDYQLTDLDTFTKTIEERPNSTAIVDGRLQFLGGKSSASSVQKMSCLAVMAIVVLHWFVVNRVYY